MQSFVKSCQIMSNPLNDSKQILRATAGVKWTVQSLISRTAPGPQAPRDPRPRRLQSGQRSWRKGPARHHIPTATITWYKRSNKSKEQTIGSIDSIYIYIFKYGSQKNRWVHTSFHSALLLHLSVYWWSSSGPHRLPLLWVLLQIVCQGRGLGCVARTNGYIQKIQNGTSQFLDTSCNNQSKSGMHNCYPRLIC